MNYWDILGITATTDQDEIRAAYRARLPQFPPEDDPEGFHNLRTAYEQAMEQASTLSSDQLIEMIEKQEDIDWNTLLCNQMIDELFMILSDPERRFSIEAWQAYCDELASLPQACLEALDLPLFIIVSNATDISARCARLLVEQMNWNERRSQMPGECAEALDLLLLRLKDDDPFDLSVMRDWPLPVQLAALRFHRSVRQLFFHRSGSGCKAFLETHTVLPLPDAPEAIERLLRNATLVGVAMPAGHDHFVQRRGKTPDDVDNLYLLATQASLLHYDAQAFDCWKTLWLERRQPQAADWLLSWCRQQRPEWLALLILALDIPQQPCAPVSDDWLKHDVPPDHSTFTLLRWYQAAHLELPDAARAFIDWRLNGHEQDLLQYLLLGDGSDPLLPWYRDAWLLWRGGITELDELLQRPSSATGLEQIVLEGLQYQAERQRQWLLKFPTAKKLEDAWLKASYPYWFWEERYWEELMSCVGRLRDYSAKQLEELDTLMNDYAFDSLEGDDQDLWEVMPTLDTERIPLLLRQQLRLHRKGIALPAAPEDGEQRRAWQRQTLFLLLLLERPDDLLGAMSPSILSDLPVVPGHPFQALRNRLLAQQSPSALLRQLDTSDPLDSLIYERTIPTLGELLERQRLPAVDEVYRYYTADSSFDDGSIEALLLFGALYLTISSSSKQRSIRKILSHYGRGDANLQCLRDAILLREPKQVSRAIRKSLKLDEPSLEGLWEGLRYQINYDSIDHSALKKLQKLKDTSNNRTLRLAATALLSFSEQRILHSPISSRKTSDWAVWNLQSRLSPKGFLLQTLLCAGAGYLLITWYGWSMLIVPALLWLTCILRRSHDMGHDWLFMIIMLVLGLLVPPLIPLFFLLSPSDPVANEYGVPLQPGYPGIEQGLQAVLRWANKREDRTGEQDGS